MIEVPTLDFVHLVDAENTIKTTTTLESLLPGARDGVEALAVALNGVSRAWSTSHRYTEHHNRMAEYATSLGLTGPDALPMLRGAAILPDPRNGAPDPATPVKEGIKESVGIVARTYLSLRIHRDFLFAMSDLYRLRLTSAVGYLRVQSETAGLMKLMATDPQMGEQWLNITHDTGKAFFDAKQAQIVEAIDSLGLKDSYREASNVAMHSRPAGVVRGILAGAKGAKPGEVRLNFQEVDDYRFLLFALAPLLRFHCKILEASEILYPEIDPDKLASVDRKACYEFAKRVGSQAFDAWQKMGKGGVLAALTGKPKPA